VAVNALKMVNADPELTSGLFTRMPGGFSSVIRLIRALHKNARGILISDKTMSRELRPDRRWQGRV